MRTLEDMIESLNYRDYYKNISIFPTMTYSEMATYLSAGCLAILPNYKNIHIRYKLYHINFITGIVGSGYRAIQFTCGNNRFTGKSLRTRNMVTIEPFTYSIPNVIVFHDNTVLNAVLKFYNLEREYIIARLSQ